MKSIIIAGPSRVGKSTLARRINEELDCFVIGVDKLVSVFQEAYPQLNIRLDWDREKTTENLAPFLGHFMGIFSSSHGRGLFPYSHGEVKGNRFVLEGGYFDFNRILPIIKMYGIEELTNKFLLIGLVQNKKTVDEFVRDFKEYDTPDDWTYGFSENALRAIAKDAILFSQSMSEHLVKYGFAIYDTSKDREKIFDQIIKDINQN